MQKQIDSLDVERYTLRVGISLARCRVLLILIVFMAGNLQTHRLVAGGLQPLNWHSPQISQVLSGGFRWEQAGYTRKIVSNQTDSAGGQ